MDPIRIEYYDYPEEVQVSEKRRATYFLASEAASLPKKYRTPQAPRGRYIYRREGKGTPKRLFDWLTKEYVVKNPNVAARPRFIPIAGNQIMRMHTKVQQKVIFALNDFFMGKLGKLEKVEIIEKKEVKTYSPLFLVPFFPVRILMEIHCPPRFGNWDLSNLWIYNKCFEDAAQEAGVFPNDHIGYITLPGAPEYFPVVKEADRKVVFTLIPETNSAKLNHLFYARHRLTTPANYWDYALPHLFEPFRLVITRMGAPGDLVIDTSGEMPTFQINVGKTEKLVGAAKAMSKVLHQAIQFNRIPLIDKGVRTVLDEHFRKIFFGSGVPVYVDDL